jgi:hypothetical protein
MWNRPHPRFYRTPSDSPVARITQRKRRSLSLTDATRRRGNRSTVVPQWRGSTAGAAGLDDMSGALVGRKWRARRWERGFGGELGHSLMAPPLNPTTPSRTLGQLVPAQERRLHRARPPLVPRSGAAITRDLHSAPSVLPRNLVECFAEEDNEVIHAAPSVPDSILLEIDFFPDWSSFR